MTIRQWMESYCTERGMFKHQAVAVVERTMAGPVSELMAGRWNDRIEGYPPAIQSFMAKYVNSAAMAYIEENCPEMWFRPLFQD